MRLSSKVVYLIGSNGIEPSAKRRSVSEIGIVELHSGLVGVVGIDVDVIDSLGVEVGGAANEAMDLVSFAEQEFSEVGTVLAGDTGDQCDLARRSNFAIGGGGSRSGFGLGRHDRLIWRVRAERRNMEFSVK